VEEKDVARLQASYKPPFSRLLPIIMIGIIVHGVPLARELADDFVEDALVPGLTAANDV